MNNTTLQLHVWLEIKYHYIQMASVVFRFALQQVISPIVYMKNIWLVLFTCAIFSDSCVYIASMVYSNLFHESLITVWNGIDILWVEAPCTVLFTDKCTA